MKPKTMNYCAGEDQQQFSRPTAQPEKLSAQPVYAIVDIYKPNRKMEDVLLIPRSRMSFHIFRYQSQGRKSLGPQEY
jgi:hypothetical protein